MRIFLKIVLYLFLAVFLAGIGIYLYLFQFGGVENIVNNKISSLVNEKYLLDIQIKDIKGNYFSGLVIEDLNIFYNDPDNKYQLLKIPRISTRYSFSNLWDKKYLFDFLTIDSAQLTLVRDDNGNWVIPDFRPKDKDSNKGLVKLPSFSIGALNIQNMSIRLLDNKDTVNFENIFLSLEFKGEGNTYAFDVEKFIFSSNQENLSLHAAGGKVTFADSRLIFKDVGLVAADTRLKIDGNILIGEKPSGEISFAADDINLEDISAYIKPNLKGKLDLNGAVSFVGSAFEGSVNIGGDFIFMDFQNLFVDFRYADKMLYLDTLYGTVFEDCALDGNGFIDFAQKPQTYHLDAEVRQFNLINIVKNSFNSNLSGRCIMDGTSFKKEELQLHFTTDLYESFFDEYPLQVATGKFVVYMDSITFLDSFRVEYFENIFYASGNVEYSGDMEIDVIAHLNNLDRYKTKLFIDQPGGRAYAKAVIDGKTSDPDLHGFIVSDSIWIYDLYSDSLYALIDIDRFLRGKKGVVEVDFINGSAWTIPFDTGYTFITIDSNIVHIDTASILNKYTKLSSGGQFDYEAVPNNLILDTLFLSLAKQKFYNRSQIKIDVDTLGFIFKQASIGNDGQWLAIDGRTNYDESMDLLLSINHIPIEPWKNLYEDSLNVDGLLSCEAALKGTFNNPLFVVKAEVDSLSYRDLVLGDLNTLVSYKNQKLTIDSMSIFSDPGVYNASGDMYLDLAFTADSIDRFPDLPMNIKINAVDNRFDLVSLMLPSVEVINGDFFADFVLSGTPNKPHLEGEAYIKNYYDTKEKKQVPVSLKYFDLEAPIYTDSAGVTMKDNKIIIDKIDTYIYENKDKWNEQKRHAFVTGEITVKTFDNFHYNLNVDMPEPVPFTYELDDIKGKAKGELQIVGDTPPTVSGDIEITEMKYDVNFAEETEGSPIMLALAGENLWNLDIDIEMLANYWIQNEDISAEFAGEINLKRTAGLYKFTGEMEILHGKGYIFDKTIRLDPGGLVIFIGDDKFNPSLDITGYTRVTGSKDNLEEENSAEQLKLGLHITGTLEEPEINVTEDSDFGSNEEILPLLVGGFGGGNNTVSNSYVERVAGLLSTQVSQIGTKHLQAIGVETFEIDPQYSEGQFDPNRTRVTLGAYLAPKFYTYGKIGTRTEVGFEYRFSKSFLMQGLKDEDGLYHANLKLNLEFNFDEKH